jgi:hypothetical protein
MRNQRKRTAFGCNLMVFLDAFKAAGPAGPLLPRVSLKRRAVRCNLLVADGGPYLRTIRARR